MSDGAPKAQIPGKAVGTGENLTEPTQALLRGLNLLGTREEMKEAGEFASVFTGPPQSVALIEAGVTAGAKWWAAGLGGAVVASWGVVQHWWPDQQPDLRITVVASAAFVTAALIVAIGHLLASDVRGRAAAAVATIDARARVADIMIRAAAASSQAAPSEGERQLAPLPFVIPVRNHDGRPGDEDGWLAVAIELLPKGDFKFLVVKGSEQAEVAASRLEFTTTNGRRT